MNPILVKELRQSVRNRYVLAAYLLFLMGLLVIIGLMVSAWVGDDHLRQQDTSLALGLTLFHTVYGIVTTVAILFIPPYVAIRLLRERWGSNLDLQFSTTIRPSSLAWGKVGSGLAVAGLLLSGAVPFMAFSQLLRGIDLPSIFLCVALVLGVLVLLVQGAVLYAAFPSPKVIRSLVGLFAGGMLVSVCVSVNTGAFAIVQTGVAASLGDAETLGGVALAIGVWLTAAVGLHAFAVAALSPPSADRMRPVRITATVLWALWGAVLAVSSWATSDPDYLDAWTGASLLVLAGFAVQATSERPNLGRRILVRVPGSRLRRLIAFPFATGQVHGLAWALLLLGATLLARRGFAATGAGPFDDLSELTAFVALVVAYALTVALLWRVWLRRYLPSESLWLITLCLISVGGIVPNLFELFSSHGGDAWVFGNVFEVGDPDSLPLALGWASLATALFVPFVVRSFTVFRRPPAANLETAVVGDR